MYNPSYEFGRNNEPSIKWVRSQFQERFLKVGPSNSVILYVVRKFRATGNVGILQRKCKSGRKRSVRVKENHERVMLQVIQLPKRSMRRTATKLGIKRESTRLMVKDIGSFSYKIRMCHKLNQNDKTQRSVYCCRMLGNIYEDDEFLTNVLFSDEIHVPLPGHINRQPFRFIGFTPPEESIETLLHKERVAVWCAVSGCRVIDPYFVTDDAGGTATFNGERYREQTLIPFVQDLRRFFRARNLLLRRQWFRQDDATSHTAGQTLEMIRNNSYDRVISRINYPSHSPDLTHPDAVWYLMSDLWQPVLKSFLQPHESLSYVHDRSQQLQEQNGPFREDVSQRQQRLHGL
ncbi:hypothetical protein ILUMI_25929, partial [Ignelater luminosus]